MIHRYGVLTEQERGMYRVEEFENRAAEISGAAMPLRWPTERLPLSSP